MQLRPLEQAGAVLSIGHGSLPTALALHSSQLIDANFCRVPTPIWEVATAIQRVGESAFTAAFIVAILQAVIAIFQYRSNPAGELIEPPGLTFGRVLPPQNKTNTIMAPDGKKRADISALNAFKDGEKNDSRTTTTSASRYAKILNQVNRLLFLLIPLASKTASSIFARQWHLMHIGFIISLAAIFDAPATFFENQTRVQEKIHDCVLHPKRETKNRSVEHVIVIGDSLAIGLGVLNMFDKNKNQTIDYHLSENLEASPDMPGPVFPRVLATKFAERQNHPVHWRSAGVDGGTVSQIEEFCLDVIHQEIAIGRTPDCIVVLCGINDLKLFFSSHFKSALQKPFRQQLNHLLVEIRSLCPDAKVVIPALPTQMFRFNSPLNIFPLAIFLDIIVGFWEAQKKFVAERFPSNDVMYVALSRSEIAEWYRSKDDLFDLEDYGSFLLENVSSGRSLLAADGVHPNAKCYAKWAESVARHVL